MNNGMIADIDGDGIPEMFTEKTVHSLTESITYNPCENNLVDTWVFSSSPFNGKAQKELSGSPRTDRYSPAGKWKNTWYLYQNCSLPLLRSLIGPQSGCHVFDSRGLGQLIKEKRIIPEVDVDDFSRTRAYHLIKARWQLTVMLDYTEEGDFFVKCEIVDKSKPIHAPAFFTEKSGADINSLVVDCLHEADSFLAENNAPPSSIGRVSDTPPVSDKIPIAILDIDALRTPQHGQAQGAAVACTQAIVTAFQRHGAFRLLERSELKALLDEQAISRLQGQKPSSEIIPSSLILYGAIVPTLSGHRLAMRTYDAETGIIFSPCEINLGKEGNRRSSVDFDAFAQQVMADFVKFQPYKFRLLSDAYLSYLRYMARRGKLAKGQSVPDAASPGDEPPPIPETYHLAGSISADTVLDMSKGAPCISGKLNIAEGVTMTIAEGTTLQVDNELHSGSGSRLIILPGASIHFGKDTTGQPWKIMLRGTLEIRGTQEKPVHIYGNAMRPSSSNRIYVYAKTQRYNFRYCDFMDIAIANAHFHNNLDLKLHSQATITVDNCTFEDDCSLMIGTDDIYQVIGKCRAEIKNCRFDKGNLTIKDIEAVVSDCKLNWLNVEFHMNAYPDKNGRFLMNWPRNLDRPFMVIRRCQFTRLHGLSHFYHSTPLLMIEKCNLSYQDATWQYMSSQEFVINYNYMEGYGLPPELSKELDRKNHKNILFRECYGRARGSDIFPIYENMVDKPFPEIR